MLDVMKIEEEIKQNNFKNEYHKVVINLKFTAGWLNSFHNRIFKLYGLSSQQFNVLRILRGQFPKPSSLILIRERMLDKESNASRLIDKLEISGYTKRVQCPNDRRQVDITITQKGIDLLEKINPEIEQLTQSSIHLTIEEAQILNSLLDKLRGRKSMEDNDNFVSETERSN
jgi:DNA-binding MarR family transcriptional regulator